MVINFYQTRSEKERLTKVLSSLLSVEGKIKQDFSLENPVIMFKYTEDLIDKNYAYIPEFGRYYYREEPIIMGDFMQISFHVDVLMSFKTDILTSTIRAIRSASNYNNMMADNMIIGTGKTIYSYRKLGNGFTPSENTTNYALIIGGK